MTMEKVGSPEFWVEFKRVSALAYDENLKIFPPGENEGSVNLIEVTKREFSGLIVAWNIPDEGGEILPIPSVDPKKAFTVPTIYVECLAEEILKDSLEAKKGPLVKETETN
tara:strand:+ start:161 stop:493 length:333 start_codon:yes stop_codon:yes gene_type:complete